LVLCFAVVSVLDIKKTLGLLWIYFLN
jgi:hypothetical protein